MPPLPPQEFEARLQAIEATLATTLQALTNEEAGLRSYESISGRVSRLVTALILAAQAQLRATQLIVDLLRADQEGIP